MEVGQIAGADTNNSTGSMSRHTLNLGPNLPAQATPLQARSSSHNDRSSTTQQQQQLSLGSASSFRRSRSHPDPTSEASVQNGSSAGPPQSIRYINPNSPTPVVFPRSPSRSIHPFSSQFHRPPPPASPLSPPAGVQGSPRISAGSNLVDHNDPFGSPQVRSSSTPFSLGFSPGFSPSRSAKRSGLAGTGASPSIRRRLFFDDGSDNSDDSKGKSSATSNDVAAKGSTRRLSMLSNSQRQNDPAIDEMARDIIRRAVDEGHEQVNLSDLGLTHLPVEICELKDLIVLTPHQTMQSNLEINLSSNLLHSFPTSLCQLQNLTMLFLSHNKLESIPPSIYHLQNLTYLSIANNHIKYLPFEITLLPKLTSVTAHPNRYLSLPLPHQRRGFLHIQSSNSIAAPPNSPDAMDIEVPTSIQDEECSCCLDTSGWQAYHVLFQKPLPSLIDLAARAIPSEDLKLLDRFHLTTSPSSSKISFGNASNFNQLPRSPLLAQSPSTFDPLYSGNTVSGWSCGLNSGSDGSYSEQLGYKLVDKVRLQMDAKHSSNICAICKSNFLYPLVEFYVWTTIGVAINRPTTASPPPQLVSATFNSPISSGNNSKLIPFHVRCCSNKCIRASSLDKLMRQLCIP
ncbi:hypothetical protein H4219_005518 [Mycoemilia scoparia]|uniref:Uncharacterized protein n=1 Tax=Mycoemilia scoparia TaxID=417184 RepID=A0A9W7ZTL9_9FUNG|nr:hypothetical protein H4219_005518 [Mycoemilia scoparia]